MPIKTISMHAASCNRVVLVFLEGIPKLELQVGARLTDTIMNSNLCLIGKFLLRNLVKMSKNKSFLYTLVHFNFLCLKNIFPNCLVTAMVTLILFTKSDLVQRLFLIFVLSLVRGVG